MPDLFEDKAHEYDTRPVPQQISEGVFRAMDTAIRWSPGLTAMDFGAGTGLIASRVAPRVASLLAVDVSPAMLEQLAKKPELENRVEVICQNLLEQPLEQQVDLIVSAMAAHHIEHTDQLLRTLFAHLRPGGQLALADLDEEDGSFHPPDVEGVFHAGFGRPALVEEARRAGFTDVEMVTACDVEREGRRYPIFLLTASRPDMLH